MPAIETDARTQKAVLWEASDYGNYGEPRIGSPIEIKVRWEKDWKETRDRDGNLIAADAAAVVDREIAIGSILWEGSYADYLDTATPTGFRQVVGYKEIPDVKGRNFRRVVLLARYRDTLPDTAT